MDKYLKWFEYGYMSSRDNAFGIGKNIYRVLLEYRTSKKPYTTRNVLKGDGNGTIMRLAPIAMFFNEDEVEENILI